MLLFVVDQDEKLPLSSSKGLMLSLLPGCLVDTATTYLEAIRLVRVFGLFVIHSALTWSAPLWSRAGAGHQHLHLAVTQRQTEAWTRRAP